MITMAKWWQHVLIAALLVLLTTGSSGARIIKQHNPSEKSQDLFLLGFGELTMHALNVSGGDAERMAFESANPTLQDGFCTNYRLSMFANGGVARGLSVNGAAIMDSRIGEEYRTIDPSVFRLKMSVESTEPLWDGWRFTGHGVYDPNRQWELENLDTRLLTQPQEPSKLELLMRLESDEHGYLEGGSLRPSFQGSKFTLHQRSIFGGFANLHSGRVGVEAVGGKLEGKTFREGGAIGIPADGTSGPYDLSMAPITRGSEEVKIEVRDRFNKSTVLSSKKLVRDIDYTVDYLRGQVLLHQPVASETAASDPIYVVITFDYLREDNDDIFGGRGRVKPIDELQVSTSYLHRDLDQGASGLGEDEPEDLVAADATFQVKDHSAGYVEVAGAENPNSTDRYSALRLGGKTEVIKNLTLNADFQRIDDQFRSFTNSDLNPNKNQERLNFGGKYALTAKQTATASVATIKGLEANGQFNAYDGLREEQVIALGYRNEWIDKLRFGVRMERRDAEDAANLLHEDNYQNRAMVDLDGTFEDVTVLGKFGYAANYELIQFENIANVGESDAKTNQLALTLTSKPSDHASIEVRQRLALRNNQDLDLYDERQDASFATIQIRPHERVNTLTTLEYRRYTVPGSSVSLWQDNPTRTLSGRTFAVEYLPLTKVKALGKVSRQESRQWFTDSTLKATDDFILTQVTYFLTHHLSFDVESEYRRKASQTMDYIATRYDREKIWDLGFKVNWNRDRLTEGTVGLIRRWQSPSEMITSTSYILLLSGSGSFSSNFFGRASVKQILLNDPIDDEKTFATLEAGYDSQSWYRVSLGYERIQGKTDRYPDRNYTGQGLFVRLTGKM